MRSKKGQRQSAAESRTVRNRSDVGTWEERNSKVKSKVVDDVDTSKGKTAGNLGHSLDRSDGPANGNKGGPDFGEGPSTRVNLGQRDNIAVEADTQIGGVGSISGPGPFPSSIIDDPVILEDCLGNMGHEIEDQSQGVEPNNPIDLSRTENDIDTVEGKDTGCEHLAKEGSNISKETATGSPAVRSQNELRERDNGFVMGEDCGNPKLFAEDGSLRKMSSEILTELSCEEKGTETGLGDDSVCVQMVKDKSGNQNERKHETVAETSQDETQERDSSFPACGDHRSHGSDAQADSSLDQVGPKAITPHIGSPEVLQATPLNCSPLNVVPSDCEQESEMLTSTKDTEYFCVG